MSQTIPTIYYHASEPVATTLKKVSDKATPIDTHLPLNALSQACCIYWENPPTKDAPLGKLLRLLHTLPNTDIVVGNAQHLIRHAKKKFMVPAATKSTVNADGKSETQVIKNIKNILLVAPASTSNPHYAKIIERFKQHNIVCSMTPVPVKAGKDAQANFKQVIKAADHVYVWVPEENGSVYQRISSIIPDMMKKPAERICTNTWQEVIDHHIGTLPSIPSTPPQDLPTSNSADTKTNDSSATNPESATPSAQPNNDLHQQLKYYVDQLKSHSLFNIQREIYEAMAEKDSPLASLIVQQKRWEKMAYTLRKPASDFKPWPVKPPPADQPDIHESWQKLQTITEEQSQLIQSVINLREDIFAAIKNSDDMTRHVKHWPKLHEEAKHYFCLVVFKKELRIAIGEKDLPQMEEDDHEATGMFKSKEEKAMEEAEAALAAFMGQEERAWKTLVASEVDDLDKEIILRFWQFYEAVAISWCTLAQKPDFGKDSLRLFLRTGYIGNKLTNINKEQQHHLSEIYQFNEPQFTFADSEVHALYLDEYLEAFMTHQVAPAYDEGLELNDRGGDEWKAARQLRKTATQNRLLSIYTAKQQQLKEKLNLLTDEFNSLENKLKDFPKTKAKEYEALREQTHNKKIARTRCQNMLEKMETSANDIKTEGVQNNFPNNYPAAFWIKKEVANFRAKTRLINRLKERHLPEQLCEELNNFNSKHTTPGLVTATMNDILANDISCCDQVLIPHKRRPSALIACVPPLILIAPGTGEMGFTLEPANDNSEGRIILPRKTSGNKDLRTMFLDCLSDYRWDTCMIQAGADWVASDSFVAAYARCRWDYRNKNKDTREKAQIDKDDNDKRNFRRHYALYEKSSHEAGKLLYYKSKLIYENIIKYFPLPPGVEKIKD